MPVETLHEWIEIIEQHGLSLVLFLLLLFLFFIPWVQRLARKEQKLGDAIEKESHIEDIIESERMIVEILGQLAHELKSQWAVVWQFHNGIIQASGEPYMKMSVTHEFVEKGHVERSSRYQNVPLSVFADPVRVLQTKGVLAVTLSSPYRSVVNSYIQDGVQCGFFVQLSSSSGHMVGVLSISYVAEQPGWKDENFDVMNKYAARISMILTKLSLIYTHPKRRIGEHL